MKRYIFIICMMFFAFTGSAQVNRDTISDEINVIAAYFEKDNKVILQWAPPNPALWELGNYRGYVLERLIIDTLKLDEHNWEKIADIKPLSLDEWRIKVEENPQDTFLMVAGQAVHGERDKSPVTMENLEAKSDEIENYFSACVLSALFSREAALAAGLSYEDRNVKKGQFFLYRVTMNEPDTLAEILYGAVALTCEEEELPLVEAAEIKSGERFIEIFWDRDYYKNYYAAFNIYRSDNGKSNWAKMNNSPAAMMAFKDESKFVFRDSVEVNYRDYYYRIEGITPFAGIGPLSEPIAAHGIDLTAPKPPYNVTTNYLGGGKMEISWMVDPKETDVAGFRISRSNEVDKGFIELTEEMLPPETRTFIDGNCNELINNFYFIGIVDTAGNVSVSMPRYGTIIDSIPPDPPVGLEGEIDTNGVVTLKWNLGPELDLKGYYVHMSNNLNHEFYNVTPYPLLDTVFRDTFPTNILNKDVYYKVVAIDHRSNYSDYSDVIVLKRPDIIPPTEPVIYKVLSTKEGIELRYYTSSSMDVVRHIVLRRFRGAGEFQEIYRTESLREEEFYLDKDLEPGRQYEYLVRAVDESDLTSDSPASVFATAYILKQLKDIKDFSYSYDAKKKECVLNWDYDADPQVFFNIYRSIGDYPYTMYQSRLTGRSFTNSNIVPEKNVKYRIIAVSKKNGWQSAFSDEIVIK